MMAPPAAALRRLIGRPCSSMVCRQIDRPRPVTLAFAVGGEGLEQRIKHGVGNGHPKNRHGQFAGEQDFDLPEVERGAKSGEAVEQELAVVECLGAAGAALGELEDLGDRPARGSGQGPGR